MLRSCSLSHSLPVPSPYPPTPSLPRDSNGDETPTPTVQLDTTQLRWLIALNSSSPTESSVQLSLLSATSGRTAPVSALPSLRRCLTELPLSVTLFRTGTNSTDRITLLLSSHPLMMGKLSMLFSCAVLLTDHTSLSKSIVSKPIWTIRLLRTKKGTNDFGQKLRSTFEYISFRTKPKIPPSSPLLSSSSFVETAFPPLLCYSFLGSHALKPNYVLYLFVFSRSMNRRCARLVSSVDDLRVRTLS